MPGRGRGLPSQHSGKQFRTLETGPADSSLTQRVCARRIVLKETPNPRDLGGGIPGQTERNMKCLLCQYLSRRSHDHGQVWLTGKNSMSFRDVFLTGAGVEGLFFLGHCPSCCILLGVSRKSRHRPGAGLPSGCRRPVVRSRATSWRPLCSNLLINFRKASAPGQCGGQPYATELA